MGEQGTMDYTETDDFLRERDPNALQDHLKIEFPDVHAEPDGTHSMECVWKNSYKCFNASKNCCYKFLTLLCAICCAIFWGCNFAQTAFTHIWCYAPCLRQYHITMSCITRAFSAIVNCCLGTCCQHCGMIFSQISISRR